MTHPLKPPRGLFVPSEVIFDPHLAASLRDTLIQLLALAWKAGGKSTPMLSYDRLTALTGKSKRTLQGHIAALRNNHAALRLQSAEGGEFIVMFDERLWDTTRRRKNLHSPVKEEEEVNNKLIKPPPPPPLNPGKTRDATPAKQRRRAKNCAAAPALPDHNLSPDLAVELKSAGVFPGLLGEVARSGLSDKDIRALLKWSYADNPEKPGGLFIARMRVGAVAPEYYSLPPCPRCGRVGEHAPSCYMRFANPADLERGASLADLEQDDDDDDLEWEAEAPQDPDWKQA